MFNNQKLLIIISSPVERKISGFRHLWWKNPWECRKHQGPARKTPPTVAHSWNLLSRWTRYCFEVLTVTFAGQSEGWLDPVVAVSSPLADFYPDLFTTSIQSPRWWFKAYPQSGLEGYSFSSLEYKMEEDEGKSKFFIYYFWVNSLRKYGRGMRSEIIFVSKYTIQTFYQVIWSYHYF